MTQGIYDFPRFDNVADKLPPENIEAEEAVLGGILLDPESIYRVWDTLKPEHFFVSAHKDIYQACIRLAKKQQPCNPNTVTTWLSDHGLLTRIGGRNKIAALCREIVSTVNIDALADLIISKAIRRQLISLGNEYIHLGYSSEIELEEVTSIVKRKSAYFTDLLTAKSEEDQEYWHYKRMLQSVRDIELKCLDPGFKAWKMKNLAKHYSCTSKDLESIYYKSLIAEENEPLMTLEELREKYGNDIKEWLLHGFFPKGSTVLMHAKGGVGKTRLAYDFFYHLVTGQDWGGFSVTAPSRKALIIQTDESPGDMSAALEDRGYTSAMTVKYKCRWLVDHMQQLRQEIAEQRPDIVLIDSLTSVSRQSMFTENDTEYARPVLMLRDIAQEFGCTILIIHHSNSEGESRGTKAIFNSVSEVWSLKRDDKENADGLDRLLKIEKSRSRAPATYRLRFSPEDKSWNCLGQEGEDPNSPSVTIKDGIVSFLASHRGIPYEVEEICRAIGGSEDTIRRSCLQLSYEGVITRIRPKSSGRGQCNRYLIGRDKSDTSNDSVLSSRSLFYPEESSFSGESDQSDHGVTFLGDRFFSQDTVSVSAESDPIPVKNDDENFSGNSANLQTEDHFLPKPLPEAEKKVILESDHQNTESDHSDFQYGDKVRLLTECNKYPAGEEMMVYLVGRNFLKLIPPGVSPSDVSDRRYCSRLKEHVEKLPRPVTVNEEQSSIQLHLLSEADLSKTPIFAEGYYYWCEGKGRVKILQIFEEASKFKKPEARVRADNEPPIILALEDLRACTDSPSAQLKANEVVICLTGYKGGEPVAVTGAVSHFDSQWVWVRVLVNDRISDPKKFYAHRVVKADE